jgi:hypothetical protein
MRRRQVAARLIAAAVAASLITYVGASTALAAGGPNLATGKVASASSTNGPYTTGNLNDGNQNSYWESTNNSFPQWAQIDLGASTSIDQVVLKLPSTWGTRTQTLSVQGSLDNVSFATIVSSAGRTFTQGSNTVTINFTATSTRYLRINITANTAWPAAQLAELEIYGATTSTSNLALGKTMSESGHSDVYVASNANDNDQATYWESVNSAFPQWLQVDLGASVTVNKVVLKTPTSGWGARTQTLSVQGSTNGSTFTDIVASAAYDFQPASANTVTVNFGSTTQRYVRIRVTANTAWPAGQISELEVYGPGGPVDTTPPSVPGTLSYSQSGTTINLSWGASTDNAGGSGLAGYDIYRDGTLATSVGASTTTWADTQPTTATVSYFVRARDVAGNQSGNSNTVIRTGEPGPDTTPPSVPTNLQYTTSGTTITLTWGSSTDNAGGSGMAGYNVYRNGSLAATIGNVTTWADNQPTTATVTYFVRARDVAGNLSSSSNSVTRTGTPTGCTNVALGKSITATGSTFTFVPTNANDGLLTTYWEGAPSYPQDLTVLLGANHAITEVRVKLNPDPAWGTRTQNIQVLGRTQASGSYTNLVPAQNYTFNQGNNVVTIPVTATSADVRLRYTSNTGAPSGQAAEFEVCGTPAPNPDLTVSNVTWSPASPIETSTITLSATITNVGELGSAATSVGFYLGTTLKGTASVGALAAGGSTTVNLNVGSLTADTYAVSAKVDEGQLVIEKNEGNNTGNATSNMVVAPVQSSDIVPLLAYSPSNPAAGNTVNFTVAIRNQGNVAAASGGHGITLTVLNDTGGTVVTRTGTFTGVINAGATTSPVSLGTWTAANGRYTVRVVLANDGNELPVKQANNTSNTSLFVGRGANMPYDMYEAEDGSVGGGAQVLAPNRTIGDLAGEASGRRAVTLPGVDSYVQWTSKAATNTLVTRFSILDNAAGTGQTSTLSIYVNNTFHKKITLSSKYMWQYGNEASPTNSPGAGPRHIYDEANVMLDASFPAGSVIKLQRDASDTLTATIDFINLEQVAPIPNPDPARYITPAGTSQQQVQAAFDTFRQSTDTNLIGVYLPPGTYENVNKFTIYLKPIQVIGAGVWYTRFQTPQNQENTNAGFDVQSSASGSTFKNLAYFGNYTSRQDGPGKVWGELQNVNNLTIDNVWVEHTVCAYWGVHVAGLKILNSRFRNTYADAVNMTNDSTGALISNNDARSNGDDAFALFSAIDAGGSVGNHDNVFENLSATLTWRAAGIAVYGGYNNVFRNLYIADMLTYSGITISSLNFGYPFVGFGTTPTRFENVSLIRAGGHFWGAQVFGAIWCFSASKEFRGIRVSDVDIVDPTYGGVMFQTKYASPTTPEFPVTDTIFTNIRISGAQRSGDQFDAKSGWGIWANEMPEAGQGPAVGSATFTNVTFSNNFQNVRNTTTTFQIIIN